VDLREERILENEQAFAAINQRLRHDLERSGDDDGELAAFVCECGQTACHDSVLHGHEIPDVEDVVERAERYLRVRKHAL
jgi:hypothetical protein